MEVLLMSGPGLMFLHILPCFILTTTLRDASYISHSTYVEIEKYIISEIVNPTSLVPEPQNLARGLHNVHFHFAFAERLLQVNFCIIRDIEDSCLLPESVKGSAEKVRSNSYHISPGGAATLPLLTPCDRHWLHLAALYTHFGSSKH